MSLPEEFTRSHRPSLVEALDGEPITSIRLNPAKSFDCEWTDTVPWCADGRYLSVRPSFTIDPRHAAGAYYVQEASSMIVGEVASKLDLPQNPILIELCAAPGGKTTHLSSVVGQNGVIVANEVIRTRAGILAQNVTRWGEGNTIVTSADAAAFGSLGAVADCLVVDAPCSGEGMFRKDHAAREEWSIDNVEHCAARQRRILIDSIDCLKVGGYLIYSTCTFNERENEDIVRWLVSSGDFELCNEPLLGAGECSDLGTHFYPDAVRGEGLFCSVLRKIGSDESQRKIKSKRLTAKPSKYSTTPIIEIEYGGRLWGYGEVMFDMVERLRASRIGMLQAGIEFGELIRGDLKPSHAYALYSHATEIFPRTELSLLDTLDYLRKNNTAPDLLNEGLQIITHSGLAVGFAKRIGGRVNNLYPTSQRILTL